MRTAFHAAGLRLTRQRALVYRELQSRRDHPDVERLFRAVKSRLPRISLFTVYRTMNALETAGMVWRVATWRGHARYDAAVETHVHFLCENCGRIEDVGPLDPDVSGKLPTGDAGIVRSVEVMLRGECENCAASPQDSRRS